MFVPECPPEKGWEDLLCRKLAQVRLFMCELHTVLYITLASKKIR